MTVVAHGPGFRAWLALEVTPASECPKSGVLFREGQVRVWLSDQECSEGRDALEAVLLFL